MDKHEKADQPNPQRARTLQRRHVSSSTMEMAVRPSANMNNVSTPVYFLVKEQAKSVVAIKELQGKVDILENVQEAVFKAVHDLQERRENPFPLDPRYGTPYPELLFRPVRAPGRGLVVPHFAKAPVTTTHNRRYTAPLEMLTVDPKAKIKSEFGKGEHPPDSENKQDSGVDSDCQNPASISHVSHPKPPPPFGSYVPITPSAPPEFQSDHLDELSDLLDAISVKGSQLRKHVEDMEQEPEMNAFGCSDPNGGTLECRGVQRKLQETMLVNESMAKQISHLETLIEKLQQDRSSMGHELERIMTDKGQLQKTIHELHRRFFRNSGGAVTSKVEPPKPEVAVRKKCLEGSKNKVSAALKETNALELQRQLLLSIIENEVLSTKLELAERLRTTNAIESEKCEVRLKDDIKQLTLEKRQFSELCEQKRRDLNSALDELSQARSKVSQLEKEVGQLVREERADNARTRDDPATRSFYVGAPRTGSRRKVKSCYSLPVLGADGVSHYLQEINPLVNTSGYLNVTREYPSLEEVRSPSPLEQQEFVTTPVHLQKSSTPVRESKSVAFSDTTFLRRAATSSHSKTNLMDVGVCGPDSPTLTANSMTPKTQLDTIRLEFDPLSLSVGDGVSESASETMGYMDSLDSKDHSGCLLSDYNSPIKDTFRKMRHCGTNNKDRSSELMSFED